MKKKILIISAMIILSSSLIFAQGNSESNQQNKPITLTIWDRNQTIGEVVDLFNEEMAKQGKNITAEFELIPYDQQVSKFLSALNAGTAPDIYSLDLVQFPYFISIGAFADISDVYKAMPYKESLPNGMLPVGSKDGKIYALPYELDVSTILYNKELFREAGLDPETPPETWDEFLIAAKALTKDKNNDGITDQWAFSELGTDAGSYMFWFMPWVWGNGGSMFDNSGNVTLNSSATKETLQFWYDLIYKYKVAPKSSVQWTSGDRYNAFVAGKIAMYLGGNFNIASLRTDAPDLDIGIAFMPRNRDASNYTFGGGNMLAITSQTKNLEAAKEFINFAYQDDVLIETYAPKMALLPRSDLYDNKYYDEIPQMADYARILKGARTPVSLKYNQIYEPVLYYFQGALLDQIPVNEAIEKCSQEITKIMK